MVGLKIHVVFVDVLMRVVGGENMEATYKDYFEWQGDFVKAMKTKIANTKMPGAGMRF